MLTQMPVFAMLLVATVPIWAMFYAGTMQAPPEGETIFGEAEVLYAEVGCAGCHGAGGAGGVGYKLSDGEVVATFLFMVVILGSTGPGTPAAMAGLAIGLALQGTLSNVAAGVMIVFFRPIKIADFVEVNGQMGTVKDITLNYTELAAVSNVQIIIPNSQVWGNTIINYSSYDTRRAEWVFGVGYGANLKLAEETIRATIMADARAKTDPEPFIQVNNLGDSSVDFLVRVWCDSSDYFAFQADMKRQVKEALDRAGVDIPFPTRTVVQVQG